MVVLHFTYEQHGPVLNDHRRSYGASLPAAMLWQSQSPTPIDTRLAYAVLTLDHLFLKSHNRFSCLRLLFKSEVQIRIHCCVPVYPWTLWYCLFASANHYLPHPHPVLLYFEANFKRDSLEYYTPDAQKNLASKFSPLYIKDLQIAENLSSLKSLLWRCSWKRVLQTVLLGIPVKTSELVYAH